MRNNNKRRKLVWKWALIPRLHDEADWTSARRASSRHENHQASSSSKQLFEHWTVARRAGLMTWLSRRLNVATLQTFVKLA